MTLIRTEPFVPLTSTVPASSGEHMDFQATVLSQPGQTQKLPTTEASAPAAPGTSVTPRTGACEPHVTVQREGDRVAGIRVQCSCGQVVDLACVYQPELAASRA